MKVRLILWSFVLLAVICIIIGKIFLPKRTAAAPSPAQAPVTQLFDAPNLTLTDQDARSFSTGALHGHVWVADFIFTSCAGSCPIMSHAMAELQKNTPAAVDFVSFTVDPKTDTPAILKEYGQGLHADFSRWHFLTGSEREMADAAYAMKIAVHAADGQFALSHSDRFLLVDPSGHVVGIYDGTNSADVARLTADAARLAATSGGKAS